MINLIPKQAKKKLLTLYWSRVLTVWFIGWSVALFLGALLLLPSYVYISGQIAAYKASVQNAVESNRDFEFVVKGLERASAEAVIVVNEKQAVPMSSYIELIEALREEGIQITDINLVRQGYDIQTGSVRGIASDRRTLSAFEDRLEADTRIANATLPHAAYAEDRDIKFDITLTFVANTADTI